VPDLLRLTFAYAARRGWSGFDPYDGLLSPLARLPLARRSRHFRLGLTQLVRRFPFNVRRLVGINEGVNPKGLALFLSAAARSGVALENGALVRDLAARLEAVRSPGGDGSGWGYNFPWQGRAFYLPAWTPTVVVTSFAGRAFLDAYDATREDRYLGLALEASRFMLCSLNRMEDSTGACLSYSPLDRTAIYNASLLGAQLFVQVGEWAGRTDLIEQSRPLVSFVVARQRPDGSWGYGEAGFQGWTDSFHTGFVLEALAAYRRTADDGAAERALRKGAEFYAERFFEPDGAANTYPGRPYPCDIHSAAQGVLTFLKLRDLFPGFRERARAVARWMVTNLLDAEGFFYYQLGRTRTIRVPFMRWSQAWGVRALAELARCGVEL